MVKEDTLSKWFTPDDLTYAKSSVIIDIAERVRTAKNVISMFVYLNYDYFNDNYISKYDFYTYIASSIPKALADLPSQVKTELVEDVYVKYKQQKDNIKKNLLDLTLTHYKKATFYKKKTTVKYNDRPYTLNKGAVKDVEYTDQKTELTVMTATLSLFHGETEEIKRDFENYVSKNIAENVQEYQNKNNEYQVEPDEEKKKKLLKELDSLSKNIWHFVFQALVVIFQPEIYDRMIAVATARRKRVVGRNNKLIVFNSLNFRGRSKVKKILELNNNSAEKFKETGCYSEINAFLDLGGIAAQYGYSHLYIPVNYSLSYHGRIDDYNVDKQFTNYQYMVLFDKNKNFKFQISKEETFDWPDFNDEMILVGGDQNIKHNMEQFSDGYSIDWPRDRIDELVKLEIRIDNATDQKKSLENTIKIKKKTAESNNKRLDIRTEVLMIKDIDNTIYQLRENEKELKKSIKGIIERTVSEMFKHYIDKYGKGNFALVLENLDGMFSSNKKIKYVCADGTEYSQNKLFRICHFGGLKDTIKRMGKREKYRVPVAFVPSYYSSQICPVCGNIDRNNRTTQEIVHCTNCNAEFQADLKSARFLTLVVSIQELRDELLEPDKTGSYVPKKSSKKQKTRKTYEKYSLAIVNRYKYLFSESDIVINNDVGVSDETPTYQNIVDKF